MSAQEWLVQRIRGRYNISHAFMATAPGCPVGPHPTRDCKCKPFKTPADAATYVAEQGGVVKS
jgi:hypothetical protein